MPGSFGEKRRVNRWAVAALAAAAVVAAALVLAGCESPSILRSEGSAGNEIVTLAKWIFGILAVVLFAVWGILVFVIITGKGRPEKEASQTKGNLRIEIIWTAIPAVIVTVLFILTVVITDRIDMPTRGAQFTAIGRQWWWDFDYKDLGFKSPNEIYAAAGAHDLHRRRVRRRDPLVLGAADGRQDRHDPRAREPHPLRAAQDRAVPRASARSSAACSTARCASCSSW